LPVGRFFGGDECPADCAFFQEVTLVVPIACYLILAAILFSVGVGAFLIKRNVITIFMSIELMLNAVNLTFVAFAHMWNQLNGQIFVFFVMVVAAAEAAVGLAIIIAIFRTRETLNVDQINLMQS
jgi:NADH-quinone oxidoreductase subunit K